MKSKSGDDERLKAGQSRWKDVSVEERVELMRAAARARWGPPKESKEKNAAAVALVARRWKDKTQEERKEIMKRVRQGRSTLKRTT